MKNKINYLILFFIFNFIFTNTVHCHFVQNNECTETFIATHAQDGECEIHDAYRYVSFGTGPLILIPNIGIGYRQRYSHHGWDTALNFSTIGYIHQLSMHLVGHYYLSQRKNSAYFGLGIMGGAIFTNKKDGGGTLSSDFVFGKELEREGDSRHFIEMHVAVPTWMNSKYIHSMYFPLMYVKYGIAF